MPFQGGLIAPALLEPARVAGASTSRSPATASIAISGNSILPSISSGGDSFYSSPFILYDQTISYTGSTSTVQRVEFYNGTSSLRQIDDGGTNDVEITTSPIQFHADNPAGIPAGVYVRLKEIVSGDFDFFGNPLGVGTWHEISTVRWWGVDRPASGTVTAVGKFELAESDLVVKARATITVKYTRV